MDKDHAMLSHADEFQLRAVSGWIGLGDFDSAHEELNKFSNEMRKHPAVMLTESELLFEEKKWEAMLPLVEALLGEFPEHGFLWINRSYALHELKRTREAFDALLPAIEKFPDAWLMRYNLACYCAQMSLKEESVKWLLRAASLGDKKEVKSMALEDPDLEPIRQAVRGM